MKVHQFGTGSTATSSLAHTNPATFRQLTEVHTAVAARLLRQVVLGAHLAAEVWRAAAHGAAGEEVVQRARATAAALGQARHVVAVPAGGGSGQQGEGASAGCSFSTGAGVAGQAKVAAWVGSGWHGQGR